MPISHLAVAGTSVDCAEPGELAQFYLALLGGEVLWDNDESAAVQTMSGVRIVAQKVESYRPPVWPSAAIVHLDLDDGGRLSEAVAYALDCGATEALDQPDLRWRVLLDPAGHPFCITTEVWDDGDADALSEQGCDDTMDR
ncbi:VOC family protein [Rhodococcus fascians]|uniref:VOC family protein n=1 Tax=Nocardiaceae TaxID=85025 RepID=UPI000B9C1DFB|nr:MULTISPECIES: VOC family protein [Rhodococcus]MSX08012.1 VOC family protein [Actinomycetota bacterium]MDJ0426209.1 VOC family protein [Rhodococcus fascians]OZE34831.1 glyoxalase [Rhodococcus sp. 05-2254-5]OZE57417.1 glyoxalase [Rhodococcus sp. 05-2254-1]OZE57492.1 glyoxalase [Rhodococcus sp. 05-2254-1]